MYQSTSAINNIQTKVNKDICTKLSAKSQSYQKSTKSTKLKNVQTLINHLISLKGNKTCKYIILN